MGPTIWSARRDDALHVHVLWSYLHDTRIQQGKNLYLTWMKCCTDSNSMPYMIVARGKIWFWKPPGERKPAENKFDMRLYLLRRCDVNFISRSRFFFFRPWRETRRADGLPFTIGWSIWRRFVAVSPLHLILFCVNSYFIHRNSTEEKQEWLSQFGWLGSVWVLSHRRWHKSLDSFTPSSCWIHWHRACAPATPFRSDILTTGVPLILCAFSPLACITSARTRNIWWDEKSRDVITTDKKGSWRPNNWLSTLTFCALLAHSFFCWLLF